MSDKPNDKQTQPAFINANRRGFLQGAAVAGGAVATGVATAADAVELPSEGPAALQSGKGYELNDYVRNYYKRARS